MSSQLHLAGYLLLLSCMTVSASLNGGYYICDPDLLVSDNVCIFAYSGRQPADWPEEVMSQDIDRAVGANICSAVAT